MFETRSLEADSQTSAETVPRRHLKKNTTTMCKQMYRLYTCGCTKDEEFKQCVERQGTNVKCTPVKREPMDPSVHMCKKHMVKEGKDEMRRAE